MNVLYEFYASLSDPVPVSVNKLYTTFRGKRVLTKAGRDFKAALTREVAAAVLPLGWKGAVDAVYLHRAYTQLAVTVHFPLLNKSWKPGAKTKSGELQSPYLKKDATSYVKATEDAVVDGTGIDDSAAMATTVRKVHSEGVWIELVYRVIAAEA